jgi:hypothetical protein
LKIENGKPDSVRKTCQRLGLERGSSLKKHFHAGINQKHNLFDEKLKMTSGIYG